MDRYRYYRRKYAGWNRAAGGNTFNDRIKILCFDRVFGNTYKTAYCILVTTYKLTEETRKRLEIMVQTNDGFEIAEADLKLRGPGDLEGTQQSGVAFDLKIADIARDGQLLQYVRDVANRIVDEDPTGTRPENAILWRQLQALRKTNINWAAIS